MFKMNTFLKQCKHQFIGYGKFEYLKQYSLNIDLIKMGYYIDFLKNPFFRDFSASS